MLNCHTQLLLNLLKCHIQPLQLLQSIPIIHKQSIIQLHAIPRGIIHQSSESTYQRIIPREHFSKPKNLSDVLTGHFLHLSNLHLLCKDPCDRYHGSVEVHLDKACCLGILTKC
ncbi:hypothetical protein Tsubulata_040350 [Turnera subulata]|uniref:Uncharacterized protein n=1 Tax=Turnera subulata TaxID=218843 RepID=A0A9Q0JHD5_9ROSI|nr:hypothetical protein Tsubulata_040350 [Turnera subulata]